MKYGQYPVLIGNFKVRCKEMMFYQYYPIKLKDSFEPIVLEERLKPFEELMHACTKNFSYTYGRDKYFGSYIYISAKHLFQSKGTSYNRPGWHCDGFLTDDVNYIWSDSCPTVFNNSTFNLSLDDAISLKEMETQALPENNFTYPNTSLLRMDQYVVHKVGEVERDGMRTFLKVSFSKDKYDLSGNSNNYQLNYDWDMRVRRIERNVPQLL